MRVYRRLSAALGLVLGQVLGCGGATPQPAESAPPAGSTASTALAPRQASPQGDPADVAKTNAQIEAMEKKMESVIAATQPARAFGNVIDVEQSLELWSLPALRRRPVAKSQRYERWRQQRSISVGFSHLSTAELSDDDRYLLAVSENEAKLRVYETDSGKLLGKSEVVGYAQYGRGTFAWQPGAGEPPNVLFAHDGGIDALAALTGRGLRHLNDAGAWQLRSSDDGAVLGANLPNIDSQTSTLVFYAWRPDGSLVPALALRFAERVDGFDLSADKSLLAVSHYPSDTVQLLDLKNRRLAWSQPAPKYVSSVDISPDGAYVAVGGDAVVIYDAREPSRQSRFTDLGNNVHEVRFSPSGDALAASAYDGRARILRAAADGGPLKLLRLLKHAGTANVYALSFTATGDRLLTSSGDKTLRVWGE